MIIHTNLDHSSDSGGNEESSEEEFEEDEPVQNDTHDHPSSTLPLLKWIVLFVCVWQSVFTIPDTAVEIMLPFMATLLKALADNASIAFITALATAMPASLYTLRKLMGSPIEDFFTEYVLCPACHTLYRQEDCLTTNDDGEEVPKTCSFVKYPNHPSQHFRKRCGSPLLKKIHLAGGRIQYRPMYVYAYQPLKTSLQRLLNRPGYASKMEEWRNRPTCENQIADIYDGKIWKEFNTSKHSNFLKSKQSYGVMLNFDFFQPYKHTTDSYGVFYLSLMNLPRSERFKQENVLLLGIIPALEHEPSSLNSFLRPLVEELKVFWDGVRLNTAESPRYKLLFKVALMCVACDIPAARKCCGFKGHSANYGCSRCMKKFPGGFGAKDFSGFDRSKWPPRTYEGHLQATRKLAECTTKSATGSLETQTGVKNSILMELPYFNPIRFTVIDPMHNLFLLRGVTAGYSSIDIFNMTLSSNFGALLCSPY